MSMSTSAADADAENRPGPDYGKRFAHICGVVWPQVFGFVTLFVAWHIASVYIVKSVLFPPPSAMFSRAWELTQEGTLIPQIGISLQRILLGFFLGSALGVPIGLAIGSFTMVRRLLEPWTEFLRCIPSVAMITIAVIWFGIGEESKIFLIMYTTIFIVILNTAAGVASIAPNKIRAAQCLGANKWQIFIYVGLPATVPFILTGMRIAMSNSFTAIVAAEMVSASEGIGVILWNGRLYMLITDIFVSLFCLGVLGYLTDRLFRWAIFRFAGRFSPVA